MSISQMLTQSGILTLLGMAVVFLFLIILIVSMKLMHAVLRLLHLDQDEAPKSSSSPSAAPAAQSADQGAVVAAIACALHEKQ